MLSHQLLNSRWPLSCTLLFLFFFNWAPTCYRSWTVKSVQDTWEFFSVFRVNGCNIISYKWSQLFKASKLFTALIHWRTNFWIVHVHNALCINFIMRFLLCLAWQQLWNGLCEIDSEFNDWNEGRLPVWLIFLACCLMAIITVIRHWGTTIVRWMGLFGTLCGVGW